MGLYLWNLPIPLSPFPVARSQTDCFLPFLLDEVCIFLTFLVVLESFYHFPVSFCLAYYFSGRELGQTLGDGEGTGKAGMLQFMRS